MKLGEAVYKSQQKKSEKKGSDKDKDNTSENKDKTDKTWMEGDRCLGVHFKKEKFR